MKIVWNGASPDKFSFNFPIVKSEQLDDGRLMVEGIATSEALDHAGEIVDYESAKAAFSEWRGNIREQHDPKKAVGKAIEVICDDEAKQIHVKAFISKGAPDTQEKIKDGTLAGFSIGGSVGARKSEKVAKADGSLTDATRLFVKRISETSVVDAGCNPDTAIAIVKAEGESLLGIGLDAATSEPDVLSKSMSSVADFANVLSSLRWIVSGAEWEKQYEGDNSPVPAQLREWLAQGLSILQAMTAEEAAELVAELAAMVPAEPVATPDVIQLADSVGDLAKAGNRNSKPDQERLNQILALVKELGATDGDEEEGDTGKAAGADDLAKAQKLEVELDTAKADLAKAEQERDTLQKRVTELEAIPAAPKGVLKVVAKAEDVADPSASITIEPITKADGSTNTVATLIKASRMMPNVAR